MNQKLDEWIISRTCSVCGSDKTSFHRTKQGTLYPVWCKCESGYVCNKCYLRKYNADNKIRISEYNKKPEVLKRRAEYQSKRRHDPITGARIRENQRNWNRERIKDPEYREKTMRGLKKMDTPILKGYQLYHNYIREHEALQGMTPADKCGIKVEGSNKWLTLIQNA